MERSWLIFFHGRSGFGWKTLDVMRRCQLPLSELARMRLDEIRQLLRFPLMDKIWQGPYSFDQCQTYVAGLSENVGEIMTIDDADYPPLLKEIDTPPWVLYLKGNRRMLNHRMLAIVGTRKPTNYGRMIAHNFAKALSEREWTVVSGMAVGVDAESHYGALSGPGKTVAVLGTPVSQVYPVQNSRLYEKIAAEGLLVSEYAPSTQVNKGTFSTRNRIISGLSKGTLVVEAAVKSGSLITANYASEQSREVFAVPGPITSPLSMGCHILIQDGAKLVTKVEDILEEFAYDVSKANEAAHRNQGDTLTTDERQLLAMLGAQQIHIDVLIRNSGKPASEVYALLLHLQLKKAIKQLPGSYFIRVY